MINSPFSTLTKPQPSIDHSHVWHEPSARLESAGVALAVWCEAGRPSERLDGIPWLVLHGGPGGRMHQGLVQPLRRVGVSWWGFDQRNCGLSESVYLDDLDTESLVQDCISLARQMGLNKFHVLAGSWGATLAIALAARAPERISSMVLRAPFIPFRSRVDAFFGQLSRIDETAWQDVFGPNALTEQVCSLFKTGDLPTQQEAALLWHRLENRLLLPPNSSGAAPHATGATSLSELQQALVLRKYQTQAHFLNHDCFLSPSRWEADIRAIAARHVPVTIVQGMSDTVCPPGGARLLSEMWPHAELIELPNLGHLADHPSMVATLAEVALRHAMPTAKLISLVHKHRVRDPN